MDTDNNQQHSEPEALPRLSPMTLLPARHSDRAQLITYLKRIDHVAVSCAPKLQNNSSRKYIVNVFLRLSGTHIPTSRHQIHHYQHLRRGSQPRLHHRPDTRVERAYYEFGRLLSKCYDLACSSHKFVPCRFCAGFVDLVLVGKGMPTTFAKWFADDAAVCEMLTKFINEIVRLACHVKTYEVQCSCRGRELVPHVVKEFLMPDEDAQQ